MKLTITLLLLAAVSHAAKTSSPKKHKVEDSEKTEKRELDEGNRGVEKRTPLLSTVSPAVTTAGVEYADTKQDLSDKSPSQQTYATPGPQIAKISDVFAGQGPPFQAAIASHLYSPISVYQPRLGSPTTYEVSAPVPSQLAYSEHRSSFPSLNAIQYTPKQQKLAKPIFNYEQPQSLIRPLYEQNLGPVQPLFQQHSNNVQNVPQPIQYSQPQLFASQQSLRYLQPQQSPNHAGISFASQPLQVKQTEQRDIKSKSVQSQILEKQTIQDYNGNQQNAKSYASFSFSQSPSTDQTQSKLSAPSPQPQLQIQNHQQSQPQQYQSIAQINYQLDHPNLLHQQQPQQSNQQQVHIQPQVQVQQSLQPLQHQTPQPQIQYQSQPSLQYQGNEQAQQQLQYQAVQPQIQYQPQELQQPLNYPQQPLQYSQPQQLLQYPQPQQPLQYSQSQQPLQYSQPQQQLQYSQPQQSLQYQQPQQFNHYQAHQEQQALQYQAPQPVPYQLESQPQYLYQQPQLLSQQYQPQFEIPQILPESKPERQFFKQTPILQSQINHNQISPQIQDINYKGVPALPTFPPVQYFGKYAQNIFGH